jgi:hypothetical protein
MVEQPLQVDYLIPNPENQPCRDSEIVLRRIAEVGSQVIRLNHSNGPVLAQVQFHINPFEQKP